MLLYLVHLNTVYVQFYQNVYTFQLNMEIDQIMENYDFFFSSLLNHPKMKQVKSGGKEAINLSAAFVYTCIGVGTGGLGRALDPLYFVFFLQR